MSYRRLTFDELEIAGIKEQVTFKKWVIHNTICLVGSMIARLFNRCYERYEPYCNCGDISVKRCIHCRHIVIDKPI